jgi:VWFA-related protein
MTGALLSAAFLTLGQGTPDASLQRVIVSVVDEDGRPVRNLSAADFRIEENGVSRSIASFVPDSDRPISIGVLVDTSSSMAAVGSGVAGVRAARAGARVLFDLMREGDEYLVMSFAPDLRVLQEFTEDRDEIDRALARLMSEGSTNLFGSLGSALEEVRGSRDRPRALVVFTDGGATGDRERVAREIRRQEVPIFTLGLSVFPPAPLPETARETLADVLARETGGRSRLFQLHLENTVGNLTSFLEDALSEVRGHYTLGYYREERAPDGLHPMRVRTLAGYEVRMYPLP